MRPQLYLPLIRGFVRVLKAVGYYEANHPVLLQLHQEVFAALTVLHQERDVELACGGSKLLIDASSPPLRDDASKSLAEHLFRRSIVCVGLPRGTSAQAFSTLLVGLGQSPESLRAGGGLVPWLAERNATGVEVSEMDFASLFAGKELGTRSGTPLVQTALRDLLRFKANQEQTDKVLTVSLGEVGTPESLGGLLDEMLASAPASLLMPGTSGSGSAQGAHVGTAGRGTGARGGGGRPDGVRGVRGAGTMGMEALSGASADELAALVTQAYTSTYEKLTASQAPEAALQKTAKVLSNVLVRLAPEARFSLLKELANKGQMGTGGGASGRSVAGAGSQIEDSVLLDTLLAAVVGRKGEPELITSIGQLIRQLRPIESERGRLLDSLDAGLKKMGHALDGMLWQELQSHAQGKDGLGLLEIPFRANLPLLQEAARRHRESQTRQPEIQRVFDSLSPETMRVRHSKLTLELLPAAGTLSPAQTGAVKALLETAEADTDGNEDRTVREGIIQLLRRAQDGRSEALATAIRQHFVGLKGGSRLLLSLAKAPELRGSLFMAELLLHALDGSLRLEMRQALVHEVGQLTAPVVASLKTRITEFGASSIPQLLAHILRQDPTNAVPFIRLALKHREPGVKSAVLRTSAMAPTREVVTLLAQAAGVESDEDSRSVLVLKDEAGSTDEVLRQVQRAAIEALGLTRSELAAKPLEHLLIRRKRVGGKAFDTLRPDAANALKNNGTADALRALAAGRNSGVAAIQAACLKAM